MPSSSNPVLLYDGVCGLCNRVVQFTLRRDRTERFSFAALQSAVARAILQRHNLDADAIDTFVIVLNRGTDSEQLLYRSDAALYLFRNLTFPWSFLGRLIRFVPRAIRDGVYRFVARHRYRVFGKYLSCPLPDPAARDRFLDHEDIPVDAPRPSSTS